MLLLAFVATSVRSAEVAYSRYRYDSVYHYSGEIYSKFCVLPYELQFKLLTTYHNVWWGEFSGQ